MSELLTQENSKIIVLENSPVDFVLVGPTTEGRKVFIRSSSHNTDLIAMDLLAGESKYHSEEFSVGDMGPFDIFLGANPGRNAVFTSDVFLPDHMLSSGRKSHLMLAWRGFASKNDARKIQRQFVYKTADITDAINRKSPEEAEWHIAPLILLCSEATEKKKKFYKTFRGTLIATFIVYALIGFSFYFEKFMVK